MIPVCLGSFYLAFIMLVLLKDLLIFVALKYSEGELKDLIRLLAIFDLVVLFSLPLILMLVGGVC